MPVVSLPGTQDTLELFGFGIVHAEGTVKHIGLLHRQFTVELPSTEQPEPVIKSVVQFCHLIFHCILENVAVDDPACPQTYWAESALDIFNRRFMAAKMLDVKKHRRNIPYSPVIGSTRFSPEQGDFFAGDLGTGLTCATFVACVMRDYGLPVLQAETWPKRASDEQFRQFVLDLFLEHRPNEKDHIEAIRVADIQFRIQPDEVAGAMLHDGPPANFDAARKLADSILADIGALSAA